MSTTFFLVRHAVKEKIIGDAKLTPQGKLQAQLTATYFCKFPITVVITSPLLRARETAEYIALKTKTVLQEDIHLRERVNWGDLPGQTFEQFIEMWNRCTRDPDYVPDVGDSAKQAGERFSLALSTLAKNNPPDSNIVVVTHGGIITDFLVQAFPENKLDFWHQNFVAEQSDLIPECSITTVAYDNGHYKIKDFASVEHLQKEY
ncbi:histidine phosphatase family protein [Cohnella thermotolerans]|uniref:histidine phosphatase family protein n=1 Tax=Cohnella thermotolerans TaxID=329858 RepID=UPI000A00F821|nr:histidine phosphatase family protein [Cohnella thermotolerans]